MGFWFRKKNTEPNDSTLSYYDGTTYNEIADLQAFGGYNVWLHYTDVITDSSYFIPDFKIGFEATLIAGENVWVDDVLIKKAIASGCDAADLDGASLVNFSDYAMFAPDWQLTGTGLAGDIEGNDVVNFDDLDWLLDYWLNDCSQP